MRAGELAGAPVPLHLNFAGGLLIEADPAGAVPGRVDVDVRVSRSFSTVGSALFVRAVRWALALVVLGLARSVLSGRPKVDLRMFTWLGAMLFAFPALRPAPRPAVR